MVACGGGLPCTARDYVFMAEEEDLMDMKLESQKKCEKVRRGILGQDAFRVMPKESRVLVEANWG